MMMMMKMRNMKSKIARQYAFDRYYYGNIPHNQMKIGSIPGVRYCDCILNENI